MTELTEKKIPYLQQSLYTGKLTNGLTVCLLPNKEYHETYGIIMTQFGAKDTVFKSKKQEGFVTYPAGIAHFLEHKLFELPDGGDMMQEFAKVGAYSNAFTNLYQTSYLFSTSQNPLPALELLQNFVSKAFFSEESIEKERGIIEQEIVMYQDDPDFRLYSEILASLYPQTPLEKDVAGSVESIREISVEDLYANFELFYQPHNMHLFLTGNFDVQEVWQQICSYQSSLIGDIFSIERQQIVYYPILENRTLHLQVACPKLAIGLRGRDTIATNQIYRYNICLFLLFSMLFGSTSERHQKLYDSGKIDSSLSLQLEVRPDYHFFVLTVDTTEPIAMSNIFRKAILHFETDIDVSVYHLELLKKEVYGDFMRSFNSLECIVDQYMAHIYDAESIFDLPQLLDSIQMDEILEVGRQFISNCDMTDFIIFPK